MKLIPINNEPTQCILSENYVAFDEDDHMWEVWETKGLFTTSLSTMGRIRFVLDKDDTILAESLPMFGFNNGFELVDKKLCDKWSKRLA